MQYAVYTNLDVRFIFVKVDEEVVSNDNASESLLEEIITGALKGTKYTVVLVADGNGAPVFNPSQDVPIRTHEELEKLSWVELPL